MRKYVSMSMSMILGLVLVSGCTSFSGETAGEYIDDSTITAQVNGVIMKDPDAGYFKIEVTTTQGDVVLQGFINNKETEGLLVGKIRQIRGVKSVKSLLRLEEKK